MTPLLIVSDLDGTLLNSGGRVSPRTRAAVRAVQRAGHAFVVASGRPVRDVRPVVEALDASLVAVCSNGAVTFDFGREAVLDYEPIGQDLAAVLIATLRRRFSGARLGCERWPDLLLEPGFVLDPMLSPDARDVPAIEDELDIRGFGKIILQAEGAARDYYGLVADAVPGQCTVTFSTDAFCEITRTGVDKATALARVAARSGIPPAHTVAFGDMPNDLPMLRWANRSVAMANAHPDVLAAAAERTLTNDQDGVAHTLERLLAATRSPIRATPPDSTATGQDTRR